MTRRRLLLPALVLAALLAPSAALASAAPPRFAGVHTWNVNVCGRAWVPVDMGGGAYSTVYNAQSAGTCISVERHHLAFQVTKWTPGTGGWQYPHVSNGVNWGRDTCRDGPSGTLPGSQCLQFPVPAGADGDPVTSVHAYWPSGMTGNVSYDLWFNRERAPWYALGQNDGAEIMIWIAYPGLSAYLAHADRTVTVDGIKWAVMHWVSHHNGKYWFYTAFMAVRQRGAVSGMRLNPFMGYAESQGWLKPSWWWTSANFGAEIDRGGLGFGVTSYALSGLPLGLARKTAAG